MQFTIVMTKTILVNKHMLSFCDQTNLETIDAKLLYRHSVQKVGW